MKTFTRFCLLMLPFATAAFAADDPPRILYLYGDVADDGTVPSGKKEPFHQMRLHDEGDRGMSQFTAAIRSLGFEIDEAHDAKIRLNHETLKNLDVLILASNQRRFDEEEAAAVNAWVQAGGGLVAWSDSAFGGHWKKVGVDNELGRLSDNDLTEQFGMYFMTDNGAGNYLVTKYEKNHFLNADKRDGGIGFRGEGVSAVRVSPPAEMLAQMQHGGLGGGIRLNKKDGELDPARDAALAIATIGKGRVVGVFDRNLFWNAGEGTRLSHNDNREFTQRLMIWAAGLEEEWENRTKGDAKPADAKD